jgi:hypothetical protein
MDVGSLLVMIALGVLAAVFIARPLFDGASETMADGEREIVLSAKKAELEHVLDLIQDLDMDHAMAKILPEDYKAARPQLVQRGANLMREIDGLEGGDGRRPIREQPDLDAEIEAEVAQLRGGVGAAPGGFCGRCGQPALAGDRFCIRCGAPLTVEGAGA